MKKTLLFCLLAIGLVITIAGCCQSNTANKNGGAANTNESSSSQATNDLVGTWLSECLVPDVNSDWSEQHQFVINADGTALYTRWSAYDHTCTPMDTVTRDYQYTLTAEGQINLTDIDLGQTIYDIYQVSGNTLKFGHGFQADYPDGYDATQGLTEANRFYVLNDYIVYTKQ